MNTNTIREKTVAEIRQMRKESDEQALIEQERQRLLQLAEEERLRLLQMAEKEREAQELKKKMTNSQNHIFGLANTVREGYFSVYRKQALCVTDEKKIVELQEDYDTFLDNEDIVYPVKDFPEEETKKMRERVISYWGLPFLDVIFAFLAIMPIIQSKLVISFGNNVAATVGVFAAIIVGLGLTLLGRWAKNCVDSKKGEKLIYFLALIVPCTYWLHFFMYSDMKVADLTYATIFSVVSCIIQVFIIKDYHKHVKALAYFKEKKKNKATQRTRDAHNEQLNRAVQNQKEELKKHTEDCITQFNKFGTDFESLAVDRRIFIADYLKEPEIPLNVFILYFGNLVIFCREEIPLPKENGVIDYLANGLDEKDFGEFLNKVKIPIPKPPSTWGAVTTLPLPSLPSSTSPILHTW